MIIPPLVDRPSTARLGLDPARLRNVGGFTSGQKHYFDHHRENAFLEARVRKT